MEHVPIAALRPKLDALDSKQMQGVVTLIWPYSSSQRQFALLLAEPDFRLRRNKGQVRVRFSSTSARALATTGVGIGDEVVLSLHGAQFVHDGAVSTPGKSVDWELAYTQTLAISVRRNGAEIANLDLLDAAPTPAPQSPVRKPSAAPAPTPQWSSPAFLKRARLSDGPLFEQPAYDPLLDVTSEGHDKKRRRKSYRDWKAWTYTARTPSPEKDHVDTDEGPDDAVSSPSRPPQLPKTPVSPTTTEPLSPAAGPPEDSEFVEETTIADSVEGDTTVDDGDTTVDDGELQKVAVPVTRSPEPSKEDASRDTADYHRYPGLGEDPPLDSQYDFGGDTELNTDDEGDNVLRVRDVNTSTTEPVLDVEDDTVPDIEHDGGSTTDLATELEDEHERTDDEPDPALLQPASEATHSDTDGSVGERERDRVLEVAEAASTREDSVEAEDTTIDETVPELADPPKVIVDSLVLTMPPPSMPVLHTDLTASTTTAMSTPVDREPSSPTLKAVDSATLPLPSPFPGEQATSYMDYVTANHDHAPLDGPAAEGEEQEPGSDADYIMENSFFSSISSSRAGGLHQDHETAFTPVRFTFGMDGAGWSRPLELSSPPPEDVETHAADEKLVQSDQENDVSHSSLAVTFEEEAAHVSSIQSDTAATTHHGVQPITEVAVAEAVDNGMLPKPSNVTVLSSDVELDESEDEDEVMVEPDEERSSEEDIESESEDELAEGSDEDRSSDDEAESEDEVYNEEALPISSQVQKESDHAVNIENEAGKEQPRPQEDGRPFDTQASATVSEVVDLGSPSADEGSDNGDDGDDIATPKSDHSEDKPGNVEQEQVANDVEDLQQHTSGVPPQEETIASPVPDTFDDTVVVDAVREPVTVVYSSPVRNVREPASIAIPDTYEEPLTQSFDDWEPQLGMDEPLPFIEHDSPTTVDTGHPDVKMESVEDGSLYLISQPETQDVPHESSIDPATELLISVPENGHKLGELQFKSVPATAPARNTRSKAKSAASPSEEEVYVSKLSTSMRSTRSKASFDSTSRATVSPPRTRARTRSTVTPSRDATQTSPYSLRSQSKHLSPAKTMAAAREAPVRRSPRKLVRRDTDFDIVPSQAENRDLFGSMFEPSQELGFGYSQASQGRYSDVAFVKDSEEDTSHSEDSMSTVHHSDDSADAGKQTVSNRGDPVEVVDEEPDTPRLKPPPASISQPRPQNRSRSRSTEQQSTIVSPTQPPRSPRRLLRSGRSTFSASPSPRITRASKGLVHTSSPTRETHETQTDSVVSTAEQESVTYPVLSGGDVLRSSPPAPASVDDTPATELHSVQSTFHDSRSFTSNLSQQTAMEPPLSFQARQPEQSLLAAPELTQTTSASASLRSFDIPLPGVQTQPGPASPKPRTSPRRQPAMTELASSSPTRQSSDAISADDEDATHNTNPSLPSIGLSTPLAYYTPLRDLIYFLNRSSQFHSSSNPDILALCTSASTAPSRAKKGQRDWSTTLHITDLSTFPAITSVVVFRPYRSALPETQPGDVVLLRAFAVESRSRQPRLRSQEESGWCVWRFGKPVWGAKKGGWGELRAREEVRGPSVERGRGSGGRWSS
ncbi:hypothetical protein EKO04_010813 [Ascochyta lentis]|uniref:Telomeric single stranded DNA binding POT1/Cdc13 domain-containing protein n=1 Tax=Ascochyta lentis TaxID=205686 RepID=A0A8H7IXV5_9PLEO|nr:hypothetical protein EKO04_010813 [Ascochyta lentis]